MARRSNRKLSVLVRLEECARMLWARQALLGGFSRATMRTEELKVVGGGAFPVFAFRVAGWSDLNGAIEKAWYFRVDSDGVVRWARGATFCVDQWWLLGETEFGVLRMNQADRAMLLCLLRRMSKRRLFDFAQQPAGPVFNEERLPT